MIEQKMITPPFLQPDDTVGIIAPAYRIEPKQWEPVISILQTWGLQIELGSSLRSQNHVFAGNDAERLNDLVTMLCNPQIKAVLCARGGYGCIRLLNDIDRYMHAFDPKWLIGYSDITALHAFCSNKLHWKSIHGPMPVDCQELSKKNILSWKYLHELLFGNVPTYMIPPHHLNRCGQSIAPLTGGNLSVIYSLNATPYQWQTDHCILFIEEVNEPLHHLDRMMTNLRIGGQLKNLRGLIVGSMQNMKDSDPPFGKTAYEIIAEHVKEYDYPVVYDFPAGHDNVNFPLVIGALMRLNVTEELVALRQDSEVIEH